MDTRTTCHGDSGGPMICGKYLYGVCSHKVKISTDPGDPSICGGKNFQSRHVFLYKYIDWMESITEIQTTYDRNPKRKKGKKKKNSGVIPGHKLYYAIIFLVTVYYVT